MPEWRKLHARITRSDDVNELPDDFCRLFWTWLPLACDSAGRCRDNAALLRAMLFPLRTDVTCEQISAGLEIFAGKGMIVRYQAKGRGYFYLPSWEKYQGSLDHRHEAEPECPAPDAASDSAEVLTTPTDIRTQTEARPTRDLLASNSQPTRDLVESDSQATRDQAASNSPVDRLRERERDRGCGGYNSPDGEAAAPDGAGVCSLSNLQRAALQQCFCDLTGIGPPRMATPRDKRQAGELWWTPLRDIANLVDCDVGKAEELMRATWQRLEGKVTVSSPRSLVKTATAIAAEWQRHNGHDDWITVDV